MANRPIDAPLPADLPENWTAGQIVAPDGTSVGLSPQHGYNYLMEQVNRAQQGVNAVNEAFENVSGKRMCRVVVGTSTAGWTAADCDFLCDGTDDQVEINQAIALLKEHGGELAILAGEYTLSANMEITNMGADVAITGNAGATVLNLSGQIDIRRSSSASGAAPHHCQLRGLSFRKAGSEAALNFTQAGSTVENCAFLNVSVSVTSGDFLFESNRFEIDDNFIVSGGGYAILIMSSGKTYRNQISGNSFAVRRSNAEDNNKLISVAGDEDNELLISNNTFSCPAHWSIRGNGAIAYTNNFVVGLHLYIEDGGLASGNRIKNGSISGGDRSAITGNVLVDTRLSAWGSTEISGNFIQVNASTPAIRVGKNTMIDSSGLNASIVGNYISGGSIGIHLIEGTIAQSNPDASHVLISDNRIYQAATPIQIEENWSGCLVTDNLFTTGDIRDFGTGNIIRGNSNDTGSGSGMQGPQGPAGQGVPTGGSAGQILAKSSAANYDTRWIDPPEGGGGASGVTMEQVNAAIQAAVLDSWEGSY